MKLYTIQIRHCAPKSCKESIVGYFLAKDDTEIMEYIDKTLMHGIWSDRNDQDGLCEILDSDYNVIGTETYKEKMLRIRGEYHEDDLDYSDAYYGITHYGWTEGKAISKEEADILISLNIAKKI